MRNNLLANKIFHKKNRFRSVTAVLLALALIATPVSDFGALRVVRAETDSAPENLFRENSGIEEVVATDSLPLSEYSGYEEGAYAEWGTMDGADGYEVYVSRDQSDWTQLDNELIRNYGTYMRADALGLTAGKWYLKVEAATFDSAKKKIKTVAETVQEVEVAAHDRSGYAWEGDGTSSGAYNEDGSLKENANVIYITEETKDTVSLEVAGAWENPCVGLQDILDGYGEGVEKKPLCIRVIGNVTMPGYVWEDDILVDGVTAGITLEGVGEDAVANGWGVYIQNSSNVEVRNLGFMNRSGVGAKDNVGLQGNNDHIWVHHCDMFYGYPGEDDDQTKGDGALDCKNSTYVTVSYNHFWDSGKSCLLGLSENTTDGLYITYHHNWFDHSDSRHPRVRFYNAHVYNNYYDGNAGYGIGATKDCSIFAENNYFRNCRRPLSISMQGTDVYDGKVSTFSSEDGGIIKAFNNYMTGQKRYVTYSATDDPATDWNETTDFDAYEATTREEKVPAAVQSKQGGNTYNNFDTAEDFYEYQLTETENVPSVVTAHAGRLNGGDFQWEFDDAVADKSSVVDEALWAACLNYTSALVSVGGILRSSAIAYCTVNFESGNGEVIPPVVVEAYAKLTEPEVPTTVPEGKDFFAGWYDGGAKWDFANPVTENMTLTGKWLVEGEGLNPALCYNLRLNMANIPSGTYYHSFTKSGFTIHAGGNIAQRVAVDGSKQTINNSTYTYRLRMGGAGSEEHRSISFEAKDAATLQLGCISAASTEKGQLGIAKLDADGNFVNFTGTVQVNGAMTECTEGSVEFTAGKASYIVVTIPEAGIYYVYGKDSGVNFYFLNLIYENGVEAPVYTISFNSMGGLSVPSQGVRVEDKIMKPSDSYKEGYVFGGWYTEEACVNEYDFSASVTSNQTLYAKWIESDAVSTQHVLDMSELPMGEYREVFGKSGFAFYASANKYLSVTDGYASVGGVAYNRRLSLNGGGSTEARSISFTIDEEQELTLVAESGNVEMPRSLVVTDGTTTYTFDNITEEAEYTQKLAAGTWYVYSAGSSIYIYYISVATEGSGEAGGTIDGADEETDNVAGTGDGDDVTVEYDKNYKVSSTKADIRVMPDKYNTGCSGELTAFKMDTENPMMAGDVLIIPGSNATRFVLDFYYRNKDISGTVLIENYDFSECSLWSYNEDKVDRQIKVVFNNCKFGGVSVGKTDENISYEFNHCTITSFNGSNTTFNRCQFGHTFSDGLVPFVDIEVNDSFFTDMTGMVTDKGAHIDGTQIYGVAGTDVSNVHYNNCRFEIPGLAREGTAAYVNACIMLQLEFSNANNVKFTDSTVNGGGYSIYAEAKFDNLTFENVKFDGIRFGDAYKYGIFYPKVDSAIEMTGVSRTDTLYVGSVWKTDGQTHFSVTNDTKQERKLVIETDKGIYQYTIPACYVSSQFTSDLLYEDFPFDVDIVVPADCQYAVCYDNTLNGCGTQIRFANWGESEVYLTKEMVDLVASAAWDDVLVEGKCGADVNFVLTKAGVLTLSGTGATENYHSAKHPEWVAYKDYIKEIVVLEGITSLGNQIFRSCMAVERVTLPDSLLAMGNYAFGGCVSLEEFTFPANIERISGNLLSGTVLRKVSYAGDDWDWVEVADGNDNWLEKLDVPRTGLRVRPATRGEEYVYTGSAIKPAIVVINNSERLTEGVDYTVKYSNNVKVSTDAKMAKITVQGKGNLTGSNSTTFKILPKDIGDSDVTAGSVVVVKGSKATPVLIYNNRKLTGKDYTIVGGARKFTEDGTLTLEGKGNFTGKREIQVKVIETSELKKFAVTVGTEDLIYNGKEQKPTITVTDKASGEVLTEKKDYVLVYGSSKVNAGTVKFSVVGLGIYSGIVNKSYKIKPLVVADDSIQVTGVSESGYAFNAKGVTIGSSLKVTYAGKALTEGKDYKVTYTNNKKVSTAKSPAKYTVQFIGNYKGSTSVKGTFTIHSAPLSKKLSGLKIVVGDMAYTGKPGVYTSKPIVTVGGVQLKASDYAVTYYKDAKLTEQITGKNKLALAEGQDSVTVYVKLVGKGNYAPSNGEYATAEYQVCKVPAYDLAKARVTFWEGNKKLTKAEYTGLAIEPTVKVEVKAGKTWTEVPADKYEVYYSNNVDKGTASVTVTAAGEDYAGSKTAKFKITAKNLKSLKDLLKDLFGL